MQSLRWWLECFVMSLRKCGYKCGRRVGDWQDDCGAFYVIVPDGSYSPICKTCFYEHGHKTAER